MSLGYAGVHDALPTGPPPSYSEPLPRKRTYTPRSLPFLPCVQFTGIIGWLCPACGALNRSQVKPSKRSWRVVCGSRGCGTKFALGFTFYQLPPSYGTLADHGLPNDAPFVGCELEYLADRKRIHRAVACPE